MSEGLDPNVEPPSFRGASARVCFIHAILIPQAALGASQVSLRCYLGADVQVLNFSGTSSLASVRQQLVHAFGKQIAKIRWKDSEGRERDLL